MARLVFGIAMICYLTTALSAADEPPIWEKDPLPQDAKRLKEVRAEEKARWDAVTVALFEKHGDTKANWAPLAKDALVAFSEYRQRPSIYRSIERDAARKAFQAAVDAGCRDQFILYIREYLKGVGTKNAALIVNNFQMIGKFQANLDKQNYPAYVSFLFETTHWEKGLLANQLAEGTCDEKEIEKEHWDRLAKAIQSAPASFEPILLDHCQELLKRMGRKQRLKMTYDSMEPALKAGQASPWLLHAVRGDFLSKYGWEARGKELADTVTNDGGRLFRDRLEKAREELEAAWKIDSTRSSVARDMIGVCKGLGEPRNTMETWFRRAMTVNPNDFSSCYAKLDYLHPKWHGTEKDFLKFVALLNQSKNYYAGFPLIFLSERMNGQSEIAFKKGRYLTENNATIFSGILERYLKELPNDREVRAIYFALLTLWDESDRAESQLKLIEKPYPGITILGTPFSTYVERHNAKK